MRCSNCNHKVTDLTLRYCINCGHIHPPSKIRRSPNVRARKITCEYCNEETRIDSRYCEHCGADTGVKSHVSNKVEVEQYVARDQPTEVETYKAPTSPSSRLVAILLALFLGIFGIHSFYLGNYSKGMRQLIMGFVGLVIHPILFVVYAWILYDIIRLATGQINYDYYDRRLRP